MYDSYMPAKRTDGRNVSIWMSPETLAAFDAMVAHFGVSRGDLQARLTARAWMVSPANPERVKPVAPKVPERPSRRDSVEPRFKKS